MERILELCSHSSKSTADSEVYVVTTVTIVFLGLLFNRPITVLWDRYLKRRGLLPADAESQTPTALNCQDRSSGAEGGSNQGLVDPPVSRVVKPVQRAVKPFVPKSQWRVGCTLIPKPGSWPSLSASEVAGHSTRCYTTLLPSLDGPGRVSRS